MDEEKELLLFCKKGEKENASKLLQKIKMPKLLQIIKKCLIDGKSETNTLIKIALHCLKDIKATDKGADLYNFIFNFINTEDISHEVLNDTVGLLITEMDGLNAHTLVLVADFIINAVRTGNILSDKPLEIFSKLITIVSNHETVPFNKAGGGEMNGTEYKGHLINNLCSCKWDPKVVVHLATMFRDIQLKEEELYFVVSKLVRMLEEVNYQEIPPLAYQLLLLSSKGQKVQVMKGLCDFFNAMDRRTQKENSNTFLDDTNNGTLTEHELRNVEGTVLLHVTFAMKQDQELARSLLKFLRGLVFENSSDGLTSFSIAVALSAASIRRMQEQVFDFLKITIIKAYKDAERRRVSKAVQELFPEELEIDEQIIATVAKCKFGCDCLLEGLIMFSFILLDCGGARVGDTTSSLNTSPNVKACQLGGKILENTFKMHSSTREEILDRILNTIASRTSQNIKHFVDLLSRLIASVPQIILDCLPKFREIFDNLSMLKPETAEDVLRAVLPIMKVSMNIKDSLMLVLRKSMAARQAEARRVAAVGFMLILKHFKVSVNGEDPMTVSSQAPSTQLFSCSQLQVSTQGRYSTAANESLCLEIIGCLRRCLSQQADVRLELYEGLYEVVCKNPPLSYAILELLLSQVRKYYERDEDITPPIKLSSCISASGEQVFLSEPLAHLFCSLQLCTSKSARRLDRDPEEDEMLSNILDESEELLQSLTKRMIKSELEDFELDKSADYGLGTSVGVKNNINACLISGIYEVLMEFNLSKGDLSPSTCESVMRLFQNHNTLAQILREKNAGGQGKKGRTGALKQSGRSLLSLKTLSWLIQSIFSDTETHHSEGLQLFRQSLEFCKFIVNCACQKLAQILESGKCDGAGGKNNNHIFKQCSSLGRSYLQQVAGDTCLPTDLVKKDKKFCDVNLSNLETQEMGRLHYICDGSLLNRLRNVDIRDLCYGQSLGKKITVICLEGFYTTMSIICSQYGQRVAEYLNYLEFSQEFHTQRSTLDSSSLVYRNIRKLQRMVINVFTAPDDELGLKEGQQLINIITLLVQHLDEQKNELPKVYTWLLRLCTEQNIDELSSTKAFLNFLLTLHHRSQTSTKLVKQIAQDVHTQLGDIEEEVVIETQMNFVIVNPKTAAPTTFILLLNHLEKMIDDNDWLLMKLKNQRILVSRTSKLKDADGTDEEFAERLDGSICYQLLGCIMAFHELTQTAFPEGTCADTITKVITKLYTLLANLSKYYLNLYSMKTGYVSAKFERLVKLTGTHLAQQVYAMITYMQATQAQSAQTLLEQTLNDKKGKDKKKLSRTLSHEKNQAMKETRSIPNLIYSIEQYEKYLIQLSKKSKINLMENFKRSTSRDFRINGATLEAALQDINENDTEDGQVSILDDENSNGLPEKRQRLHGDATNTT